MRLARPMYLTADLPGIGGLIKQQLTDFQVDELPAYKPEGVGTHCYLQIEKRGYSTMAAADIVARALGRRGIDIGYAGLKDKQAVTTQWFSVEHLESATARSMKLPEGMRIVAISRHRNKIKRGHLAGNKFTIKVRNPEWTRIGGEVALHSARSKAEEILGVIHRLGAPNFFGPQRFGMRRDNHQLGLALLKDDAKGFIDRFLGDPDETVDHGGVLAARQSYQEGNLEKALSQWPGHLRDERRALVALAKSDKNAKRAIYAVDLELKRLMVSALQSFLFNKVLERRLPKMGVILPGDFCMKHENGASFRVGPNPEDARKEQPRADAHEISPTGPLYGRRMSEAEVLAKQMESEVLHEFGLSLESFAGPMGAPGSRRPLRFFPEALTMHMASDEMGDHLVFSFTLPPGTYATVLMGEVMKTEVTID